jgi:NitT/TauT family transport system permease protein
MMKKLFFPQFLEKTSTRTMIIIGLVQLLIFIAFAQLNTNEIMPKPLGIANSTWNTITEKNFLDNFFATLGLILKSMSIAIGVSLFFVYLSLVPGFKNITTFISKLRYLTYTGLLFVFTIMLHEGHTIKISLLLFGIIPYFVTSLLAYTNDINPQEYELCYTLKFNRWRTLYEVVIKGKLHTVLEVIRQNFAIAWMMITSVEGICMSEGGLGTMMIKSNKYLKIDDVFGVLLVILALGILFDYLFDLLKVWLFPYVETRRYSRLWVNRFFKK